MQFTHEHEELRRTLRRFIDTEINPHVDDWEAAEIFPAHELFKKMGDQGYLGINKPTKYGGMGLDYSYELVFIEALGHIRCGGVIQCFPPSQRTPRKWPSRSRCRSSPSSRTRSPPP